jgi:hypothetical protein
MSPGDKPLVSLHGEISTPPLSKAARLEAGDLLRMLQKGETLPMPHSRPMPAIVLLEVFEKKTKETPRRVIDVCKERIRNYES